MLRSVLPVAFCKNEGEDAPNHKNAAGKIVMRVTAIRNFQGTDIYCRPPQTIKKLNHSVKVYNIKIKINVI